MRRGVGSLVRPGSQPGEERVHARFDRGVPAGRRPRGPVRSAPKARSWRSPEREPVARLAESVRLRLRLAHGAPLDHVLQETKERVSTALRAGQDAIQGWTTPTRVRVAWGSIRQGKEKAHAPAAGPRSNSRPCPRRLDSGPR